MEREITIEEYVADYLNEELGRLISPAMWGDDLDQVTDRMLEIVTNAFEAYEGGAR